MASPWRRVWKPLCTLALLTGGCGRIDFVPRAPDADAVATVTCWPAWLDGTITFSSPTVIPELATAAQETNPFLATDGLHLFYDQGTAPARDLVVATRSAPDQPFGTPTSLSLNTPGDDARISFTADGTLAALANDSAGNFDIYLSDVTDGTTYSAPSNQRTAALNTAAFQASPELSDDGLSIYFAYQSTGVTRVQVATRAQRSEPFGAPIDVPGLDPATAYADPSISPDERVLVMTQRTTMSDIYYATRGSPAEPFSTPVPLASVNSASDEDDPTVSADGCELVLARGNNRDLYRASSMP